MAKKFLILITLLVFFLASSGTQAQEIALSDSAEVSILTNSPWSGAIYGLFGHASIRVKDPAKHIDLVFNYGMFSFNKPNFIYHFAKGETDYMVAAMSFPEYLLEYQMKGQEVDEQVIRLTQKEKQQVWNALCINALPENREYRYNFFFDNCATRLFVILEKNIDGKILLAPSHSSLSFRNMLNEFLNGHVWEQFGINLVVGSGADTPVTAREKLFLPSYLYEALNNAQIQHTDGNRQSLVSSSAILNPKGDNTFSKPFFTPWLTGILLFAIALLVSFMEWKNGGAFFISRLFDTLIFAVAGLSGIVLTFLMFFSVHPCMSPNWNYLWLQPLHLVASVLFFVKSKLRSIYYYHFINFAVTTLFLVCWKLIPQELLSAFIPFVLTLWLRSGAYAFIGVRK